MHRSTVVAQFGDFEVFINRQRAQVCASVLIDIVHRCLAERQPVLKGEPAQNALILFAHREVLHRAQGREEVVVRWLRAVPGRD